MAQPNPAPAGWCVTTRPPKPAASLPSKGCPGAGPPGDRLGAWPEECTVPLCSVVTQCRVAWKSAVTTRLCPANSTLIVSWFAPPPPDARAHILLCNHAYKPAPSLPTPTNINTPSPPLPHPHPHPPPTCRYRDEPCWASKPCMGTTPGHTGMSCSVTYGKCWQTQRLEMQPCGGVEGDCDPTPN